MTEKSQVNLRSHKVIFFQMVFSNQNMFSWTSLIVGFQKWHFHLCATSRNAHHWSLMKWRHQRVRFLGYTFAKNRYINLKFGMLDVRIWFYDMFSVCVEILKFLDFNKKYKNQSLGVCVCVKNHFLKKQDGQFRDIFVLRSLVYFLYFIFNIYLGEFSNFCQFSTKKCKTLAIFNIKFGIAKRM